MPEAITTVMPFYEYECSSCKFYTEVMQKISDAPLTKCPSCGRKALKKLVSAPVFRLKGAGWYETDFKSDKESKRNLAGAEKEEAARSETPKAEAAAEKKDAKEGAKGETKAGASAASGEAKPAAASAEPGGGRSRPTPRKVSVKSAGRAATAASRSRSKTGRAKGKSRSARKKTRR